MVFAVLAVVHVVAICWLFDFPEQHRTEFGLPGYIWRLVHVAPFAGALLGLALWPKRREVVRIWAAAAAAQNWPAALLLNACHFLALAAASIAFTRYAATTSSLPWGWLMLYCGLLAATAISVVAVAVPTAAWWRLIHAAPLAIALVLGGVSLMFFAGDLVRQSWSSLAFGTLLVTATLLSLYEPEVVIDTSSNLLGAGDFHVLVYAECSGYEGMAIVTIVTAVYLCMFRDELRFPHALLLLPIGMIAVAALNIIRIAALISIGAHVSPDVALDGFHSQAGSISFLLVSLGLMAASQRMTFFRATAPRAIVGGQCDRLVLALLLPFAALMATTLLAQAFAPNHHWLYGAKVAAVGWILWRFRDVYSSFVVAVSPLSLAAGAAVGVAWIMTDPAGERGLGTWLTGLPLWLAALWLTLRTFGAVVLVPIAEELAFRGYLHRILISRQLEDVTPARFHWLAFLTTSVLFGLLHQRWIAGALAGAVYALVMYRSGRLADPVAAHVVSNAVIVAWAITAGQWSLL